MKTKSLILLFILSVLCNENSFSQAGVLDNSFGANGIRTINYAGSSSCFHMPYKLQNGGYLVYGDFTISTTKIYDFQKKTFVKYFSNGDLDTTLWNGAFTCDNSDTSFIEAFYTESVMQSDGKIVVMAYESSLNGADKKIVFRRYLNNGLPDVSYGIKGKYSYQVAISNTYIISMIIQSDDKVLFDISSNGGNYHGRLTANGTADSTFGQNGIITNALSWYFTNLQSGKYLTAGELMALLTVHLQSTDLQFTIIQV